MPENTDSLKQILQKIELLQLKQNSIHDEINLLKKEVEALQLSPEKNIISETISIPLEQTSPIDKPESKPNVEQPVITPIYTPSSPVQKPNFFNVDSGWEKFIGENLLNKIGIIVLVIGVAIGAKYAIDHQLVSPLTRIVMGYIMGFGLMGFALYLKKNYENFSAVLLSGSLSILYIITFIAYSFYSLIPQSLAFFLMVLFTIFTVLAARHYKRQIIALLGLVGAYAVPFLLSNDTGNVLFLFTYIGIINLGILVLAFIQNWKWVNFSAFVFTWIIYFSVFESYYYKDHFTLLFGFLLGYFIQFYTTLLAYKFYKNEKFEILDIALLLFNSVIFFTAGYALWNENAVWKNALGLFSLSNALLHFGISVVVYRKQFADQNMFYFIMGLVLAFLTITIPVQLDGNWVTSLWVIEAVVLFWIGRTKSIRFYEILSYVVLMVAFFSLLHDWSFYRLETVFYPIFNWEFAGNILFSLALSSVLYIHHKHEFDQTKANSNPFLSFISIVTLMFLLVLYLTFRLEITHYWDSRFNQSAISLDSFSQVYNFNLPSFKAVWIINYSIVFFALISYLNFKYFKKQNLAFLSLVLGLISMAVFLIQGLNELNTLQRNYYHETSEIYTRGTFMVGIRYVSFALVALYWLLIHRLIYKETDKNLRLLLDLFLHISILAILSNELIEGFNLSGFPNVHKSALSILWGIYSFILITFGIWKKKKHLRIGAIILFGVTLFKLVFYDLSHLETIPKTIVFVILGLLLLIISFLYNKYQKFMEDDQI